MRVVFVCSGNICRSPAAHAVLHTALTRAGRRDVVADSAGIGGWHRGELPDPRTRAEGARRGHRVDHPARQVDPGDFGADCVLVAMDHSHLRALHQLAPAGFDRIHLFRRFDPDTGDGLDVADPYYGDETDFAAMYDVIERTMPALLAAVAPAR